MTDPFVSLFETSPRSQNKKGTMGLALLIRAFEMGDRFVFISNVSVSGIPPRKRLAMYDRGDHMADF